MYTHKYTKRQSNPRCIRQKPPKNTALGSLLAKIKEFLFWREKENQGWKNYGKKERII